MINPNAAGIDVGAKEHVVAVPCDRDLQPVRTFQAFTPDLHELAAWLKRCGIQSVALESTGIYWLSLYEVLEQHDFEVRVANARHVKHVPGRTKTDVLDCQWIRKLHSFGLLNGSFRPDQQIRELRTYMRLQDNLVVVRTQAIHHMQKALFEMNVQLSNVISDLVGETGLRIIEAILAGERDPEQLALEVGLDMSSWKTEKQFASFLGLCPNNLITGGKVFRRDTRKVYNRLRERFKGGSHEGLNVVEELERDQ